MGHIKDMVPSSSGLGRGPLKAKTRVQISLGPPIIKELAFLAGFFYYSGVAPPHSTSFLRVSFSELPRESRNISLYSSMRQIIWLIVITGLVPVILVQQEPKQVNKLALLLHKYRFRQDCRNTSGNDSKRRWFNTCCLLFKYHSPEANASASPAGGEVVNC